MLSLAPVNFLQKSLFPQCKLLIIPKTELAAPFCSKHREPSQDLTDELPNNGCYLQEN